MCYLYQVRMNQEAKALQRPLPDEEAMPQGLLLRAKRKAETESISTTTARIQAVRNGVGSGIPKTKMMRRSGGA